MSSNTGPTPFTGGLSLSTGGTASILAEGNTVTGNSAGVYGGMQVVQPGEGPVIFRNNIVASNSGSDGGGISVAAAGGSIDVVNNTVFGNTATSSAGGAKIQLGALSSVSAGVYNNLLFGNTAPAERGRDLLIQLDGGTNSGINVFNNDFAEACLDDDFNAPSLTCDLSTAAGVMAGANINEDPLFVDPDGGNFNVSAGSPAIDAGDSGAPNLPAADHAGNARITGDSVDLGALEFIPAGGTTAGGTTGDGTTAGGGTAGGSAGDGGDNGGGCSLIKRAGP